MDHTYESLYKNVYICPLKRENIGKLRNWRNDASNTKYLRQIPYITEQMQSEWFEAYLSNKNEIIFEIHEKSDLNRMVGSLSLYNFKDDSVEFGKILIGDKEAHGKKIGQNALIASLIVAFKTLKVSMVHLDVFSDNIPARRIYERVGFSAMDEHVNDGMNELYMEISKKNFDSKGYIMPSINDVRMIAFPQCGDSRGRMNVVEGNMKIPFEIKRIFYSYATDKEAIRGQHANKYSEFVMICVVGSCKVRVVDMDGTGKEYILNSSEEGLYIPKMLWKDMYDFSSDCVLLVLSSEHYDANEYIKNYENFLNYKNAGGTL